MSRRRKSYPPQVAVESLESRRLLCSVTFNYPLGPETLHWQSGNGVESYEVWLNDAESNQLAYREDGLADTEFDLESIVDGDYFFWIQDEDAEGNGPWRERQDIKVRGGRVIGSAGLLTWPELADAESYEVWISRDGTKIAGAIGLTENSFQLPAMDNGDYDYWIRRVDREGDGAWNSRMKFAVESHYLVREESPGILTWDAAASASGYEAWIRSTETNKRVAGAKYLANASFTVPNLDDGSYELLVKDESADGGTWRYQKPFLVKNGELTAAPSVGTIEWNATAEAVSHTLWVSEWGQSARVAGATGLRENSFRLPDLSEGTYNYWVGTLKSDGTTEWSERTTFLVEDGEMKAAEPVGTLTWDTAADAASYDLWIGDSETGQNVFSQWGVQSTSTEVPYMPDGLYKYWIKTNTATESAWSDYRYFRVTNGNIRTTSGYLYWEAKSREVSYEVEIKERYGDEAIVFRQSGITDTQVFVPMQPDGSYQFRVQYENQHGNGTWSEFHDFRIEDGGIIRFTSGPNGSFGYFQIAPTIINAAFGQSNTICALAEPVTLHL